MMWCQTGTNRIFHFFICSMVGPFSAMSRTNSSKNVLLACPHERCPRMFTSSRSLNAHLSGCPFLPCINPRLPRCSPRKATQDGHLPDCSQTTTNRFPLCTEQEANVVGAPALEEMTAVQHRFVLPTTMPKIHLNNH